MASTSSSTINVLGEPERVNLVVRALWPDYLLFVCCCLFHIYLE